MGGFMEHRPIKEETLKKVVPDTDTTGYQYQR
jgi:hypothetical protein